MHRSRVMALNPKQHVTLTVEELEDIKNAAMERAEEMEWQLRVELQKIREIERNLSLILGEASQVAPAAAAPVLGRGTPLHGTTKPTVEPKKRVIAAVPPAPAVAPPAPPATHVGPPPAPPAVPAPLTRGASATVPTVRSSWTPPTPPVRANRPSAAPPPLPPNVHRLNPPRKA